MSQRFTAAAAVTLGTLALLLASMSVLGQVAVNLTGEYLSGSIVESLAKLFNASFYLNKERSFSTLYAAVLLLMCSVLLIGITLSRREEGARYVRYWGGLAVIFLYMFADELLQIHEEFIKPLRALTGAEGFLYYTWIVPALVLLPVLGILYAGFVVSLPARTRFLFLSAGLLYITGALGLEMLGGYYADVYGEESVRFIMEVTAEEFLEMLGLTTFVYGLLEYIRLHTKEIVVPPMSKDLR
jgi:hypothetical protein